MLFGMTWWASLFVLLSLFTISFDLASITDDEDEDPKLVHLVLFFGRLLYYVALIALAILYFQDFDSVAVRWSFIVAALYSLPFSLYLIVSEFLSLFGSSNQTEENESIDLVSNVLGYTIVVALCAGGVGFAIAGGQPLLSGYI